MPKKTLLKVTAIVVCFAFLLLSSPGLASAKARSDKFNLNNIIKKPVTLFSSLLSFLPIHDSGMNADSDGLSSKKTTKRVRITGDLNCGRVSGDD